MLVHTVVGHMHASPPAVQYLVCCKPVGPQNIEHNENGQRKSVHSMLGCTVHAAWLLITDNLLLEAASCVWSCSAKNESHVLRSYEQVMSSHELNARPGKVQKQTLCVHLFPQNTVKAL